MSAKQSPTDEQFVSEAIDLVERARDANIPFRIMAGCAVRIHCSNYAQFHQLKLKRNIRDIDIVTLSRHKKEIEPLFLRLGYDPQVTKFGMDRDIYENSKKGIILDLFFDRLVMCHTIDFVGRLENDFPTITLADLVLQKLQIVEINERDVKDLLVLFLEHEIGETDNGIIDGKYLARLLSNDWGFYYTVTENIKKSNSIVRKNYSDLLSDGERQLFEARTAKLLAMIEAEPKSFKWRMRQKVGTKSIWYNEVEEKERGTLAEYLIKKNQESGISN